MKRSVNLILAGGLTTIVALVIYVLGLSAFITPTRAEPNSPASDEAGFLANTAVAPVNVEATAQAIQYQNQQTETQAMIQEREAALQAQIAQSQQAVSELDSTSQAQLAKMRAEMVDLKAQIEQTTANIQAAQAHLNELQQAIQNDDGIYQDQLAALETNMTQAESQIKQEMEAAYAQLQTVYNEIAQRQAAAAQISGDGGSGGGGDSHEDHEDRGEDHEDDHGGDHEDGHGEDD
jgi:hypothetical protein